MQQQKPTQFRSEVARDFAFSELPKSSAAETGFGRGYTVGFFACVGVTAASFAALFVAGSDPARTRAVGYLLMSFGATFTFAVVYTVVTKKGIPWSASWFGRVQTGVLDRQKNAIRFWGTCAMTLLICLVLIGGGIWVVIHPIDVAAFLQQHRRL